MIQKNEQEPLSTEQIKYMKLSKTLFSKRSQESFTLSSFPFHSYIVNNTLDSHKL